MIIVETKTLATYRSNQKPFSLNNAFKNAGKFRVKTKEYKRWKTCVALEFKLLNQPKVSGAYKLFIRINQDCTKADIDNLIKGYSDVLVEIGAVEDDRFMRGVDIEFEPRGDNLIVVQGVG